MRVCVLGLGHIGLPVAKYVAKKGLKVHGYDINPRAVALAGKDGISATTDWSALPNSEAYLICVSTLWRKGRPHMEPVLDASRKISERIKPETLVSIESTIVPGTCRKIYEETFKMRARLIHVPHRYWEVDPVRHGVKQLRVIGGVDPKSLNAGVALYRDLLGIPLHIASNIEVAELCKVAENSHRYIQIAFAEELKLICTELKLDFEEVRKACNTKWNVQMLEARDGVKGHCIPKDTHYLAHVSKHKKLLEGAMKADRAYQKWWATLAKEKTGASS